MRRGWLMVTLLAAGGPAAADTVSPIEQLHRLTAQPLACERRAAADEIVVCADRMEDFRYRLPLRLPPEAGDMKGRSPSRERHALVDFDRGGVGTCSQVGPGGASGCMQKRWEAAAQQAAGASGEGRILFVRPN